MAGCLGEATAWLDMSELPEERDEGFKGLAGASPRAEGSVPAEIQVFVDFVRAAEGKEQLAVMNSRAYRWVEKLERPIDVKRRPELTDQLIFDEQCFGF